MSREACDLLIIPPLSPCLQIQCGLYTSCPRRWVQGAASLAPIYWPYKAEWLAVDMGNWTSTVQQTAQTRSSHGTMTRYEGRANWVSCSSSRLAAGVKEGLVWCGCTLAPAARRLTKWETHCAGEIASEKPVLVTACTDMTTWSCPKCAYTMHRDHFYSKTHLFWAQAWLVCRCHCNNYITLAPILFALLRLHPPTLHAVMCLFMKCKPFNVDVPDCLNVSVCASHHPSLGIIATEACCPNLEVYYESIVV